MPKKVDKFPWLTNISRRPAMYGSAPTRPAQLGGYTRPGYGTWHPPATTYPGSPYQNYQGGVNPGGSFVINPDGSYSYLPGSPGMVGPGGYAMPAGVAGASPRTYAPGAGYTTGWNPRYGATQTGPNSFAEAYNQYGQPAGTQLGAYLQSGGPPRLGSSTQTTMAPEQMQQQIADLQAQLANYKFNDMSTDVKNVSYGKLVGKGSSRRYNLMKKRLSMFQKISGAGGGGASYGVSPAGVSGMTQWSV